MPLLRAMAATAVVSGTSAAVSNRVSRRQAQRWANQGEAAPAYMAATPAGGVGEPYPPPPPPGAAPAAADPIEQLKELGELHSQGILTDEEFAAQKAKVLGQ
jgi:Short C-terminal domain